MSKLKMSEETAAGFGSFRYMRLKFYALAEEAIDLPTFAGPVIRGGLGYKIRGLVCIHGDTECSECILRTNCVYASAFRSPQPDSGSAIKRARDLPPPFIIESLSSSTPHIAAGSRFTFGIALFGHGLRSLPYVLIAFERLGRSGLGPVRGRFRILRGSAVDEEGREIDLYTEEGGYADLGLAPVSDGRWALNGHEDYDADSHCTELEFLTPLQLKSKFYRNYGAPSLDVLIRPLLRRLSLMSRFHCNREIESPYRELFRLAESSAIAYDKTRRRIFWRYSSRQNREIRFSGSIGRIGYRNVHAALIPYLKLGQAVHLGKNASFGMGKYRLRILKTISSQENVNVE